MSQIPLITFIRLLSEMCAQEVDAAFSADRFNHKFPCKMRELEFPSLIALYRHLRVSFLTESLATEEITPQPVFGAVRIPTTPCGRLKGLVLFLPPKIFIVSQGSMSHCVCAIFSNSLKFVKNPLGRYMK